VPINREINERQLYARMAAHARIWSLDLKRFRERFQSIVVETESDSNEFTGAESRLNGPEKLVGSIAVLPLRGLIAQHDDWWGISTDSYAKAFDELIQKENVRAIVLDIDSPGGVVYGVAELARHIRRARGKKPIVAVANSLAASAAYWIASAADRLVVTPGGEVGSIGVFMLHMDVSEALKSEGIKMTFIEAGRYKTEGNPFEPLGDEAKTAWQEDVDRYYEMFVADVAKGRNVTAKIVKADFGEGRLIGPKEAISLGMADRVASLEEVLDDLSRDGRRQRAAAMRAAKLRNRELGLRGLTR